ncbi:MAG: isoleucine--tRNA ligase, partial [Paenibacillaceae bacterium]|nr:isoleucine--tRNA ligase [Paenibacillaceae bacterium]
WSGLYARIRAARAGKETFVVHDGPPYANGNIHIGHALNKIIKDIIVRHKTLQGYDAPFVPGWDTHGLPIEQAIVAATGVDRKQLSATVFRSRCAAYAAQWIDTQRTQFARLGVLAEWDAPYVTMHPSYEAEQVRLFGAMMRQGAIYKGLKPVYWSPSSESALAEAEIEYREKTSPSIVVSFALREAPCGLTEHASLLIWTTTPWTLPANVAICVHPDAAYAFLRVRAAEQAQHVGRIVGLAVERIEATAGMCGWHAWDVVARCRGRDLERLVCVHPWIHDRDPIVVCGLHVTMDAGTGCVHTAPGHGEDDFVVGTAYGLPVRSPVDAQGMMTAEAGAFAGIYYEKANARVIQMLNDADVLLYSGEIVHQVAHDWRTKKPVIFRATEQWFASIAPLRGAMLEAIRHVQWTPTWGEVRMHNMIAMRGDWCISRQRVWGVPIPIQYCASCGAVHADEDTIEWIAQRFSREGSDAWFADRTGWTPPGTTCAACGHDCFVQEMDIMDVWFDSGASHAAVLGHRVPFPADVYVEGSDQYRGWFNSSLITSIAVHGKAPFRAVISHGFTMDGDGRKMSKSLGNTVDPAHVCDTLGADILRLWVASVEWQQDQRLSEAMLKQTSESYRKMRNTFRFLLGNLHGYDVQLHEAHCASWSDAQHADAWSIHRYMWHRLETVRAQCIAAYDRYEFHVVVAAMHQFLSVELSALYLDMMKDTLYAEETTHPERTTVQAFMMETLLTMTPLMAPIMPHTAEEVWNTIPGASRDAVQLQEYTPIRYAWIDADVELRWKQFFVVRDIVFRALEQARNEKRIASSMGAHVTIEADAQTAAWLHTFDRLDTLLIVARVTVRGANRRSAAMVCAHEPNVIDVTTTPAEGTKCARCWKVTLDVGCDAHFADACRRCADVLRGRESS